MLADVKLELAGSDDATILGLSEAEVKERLLSFEYADVEEEYVENRKGTFVHLRWVEDTFPVEVTIHHWADRQKVPISSVTGKPMKRADLDALRKLLQRP